MTKVNTDDDFDFGLPALALALPPPSTPPRSRSRSRIRTPAGYAGKTRLYNFTHKLGKKLLNVSIKLSY